MPRPVRRRARRTWPQRLMISFGLFASTALLLAGAGVWYAKQRLDNIQTVDLGDALTPKGQQSTRLDTAGMGPSVIENYLLVGSDSREGVDPEADDFGGIGEANGAGKRSDTIMVLRFNPADNSAAVLSLPRDLLVPISGHEGNEKINAAFAYGPEVLTRTITEDFGIPIHHYVEIDFEGFRRIVDAIGGVTVYFANPSRDTKTGLLITEPGCVTLDGVQARQYVRSRYFQEKIDGKWRDATGSDIARIDRQQDFIRRALLKALEQGTSDPFVANDLISAAVDNLIIDSQLDIWGLANRLRTLGSGGITSYTVPADGKRVNGADVLIINEAEAQPLFDYFSGVTNTLESVPADPATTETGTAGDAVPADQEPVPEFDPAAACT